MASDRELRDQLEAVQVELRNAKQRLEKLRTKHESEREATTRDLERAHQNLAAMRKRAESAENLARELQERVDQLIAQRPVNEGGAHKGDSILVALARAPEDLDEAVMLLSNHANLPAADARLRLRALPPIPLLQLPASEADAFCAALRDNGLHPVSCNVRLKAAERLSIQSFELKRDALVLVPESGDELLIPYKEVQLLLRGARTTSRIRTEEEAPAVMERLFSVFREDPTSRILEPREPKEERIEHFLWLYSASGKKAAMTSKTSFAGLGARREPSLAGSIKALAMELLRRAPGIVYEERLVRMARWKLGLLREGDSHEALAELLWQSVRSGLWQPGE
jgi:hypothetical protein